MNSQFFRRIIAGIIRPPVSVERTWGHFFQAIGLVAIEPKVQS